jgi:hypothetical protein
MKWSVVFSDPACDSPLDAVLRLCIRRFRLLRADEEILQCAIPLARIGQRRVPHLGQLVVTSRRALLALSHLLRLPTRRDYPRFLESAQRRIDRPAGQPRDVDDVEPVLIPIGQCLQDDCRRVSKYEEGVKSNCAQKLGDGR